MAYTSGYEVQEKLNLEGRGKQRQRARGDDALLQAVAHAVETAGLWRDTTGPALAPAQRRAAPRGDAAAGPHPVRRRRRRLHVRIGMPIETALYIRFAEGDDVLVASPLEIDRARKSGKAARTLSFRGGGLRRRWAATGSCAGWPPSCCASATRTKRGSRRDSHAVYLEELRAAGVDVAIDQDLFVAERRQEIPRRGAPHPRRAARGRGRGQRDRPPPRRVEISATACCGGTARRSRRSGSTRARLCCWGRWATPART